jgi:hypothetical protein
MRRGLVIAQAPSPSRRVASGSTVSVILSNGPAQAARSDVNVGKAKKDKGAKGHGREHGKHGHGRTSGS